MTACHSARIQGAWRHPPHDRHTAYVWAGDAKPLLEEAFGECAPKYEPIVVYTDPPPGRNTVMIGFDRPFYQA
jgi:hypothetical protein|eukprot:COSAG03_NODE_10767_length_629_cov_2.713208_2_plen_73_part_00